MFSQHRWECISPNIRMYFSKYKRMYFSKYKWGNLSLVSPWNIVFPSLANTKHLFHRKLGQRKFSKNVIFVHQPHTTSIDHIIIIITTRSLYYNALPVSYIMQHFPKALRSPTMWNIYKRNYTQKIRTNMQTRIFTKRK